MLTSDMVKVDVFEPKPGHEASWEVIVSYDVVNTSAINAAIIAGVIKATLRDAGYQPGSPLRINWERRGGPPVAS